MSGNSKSYSIDRTVVDGLREQLNAIFDPSGVSNNGQLSVTFMMAVFGAMLQPTQTRRHLYCVEHKLNEDSVQLMMNKIVGHTPQAITGQLSADGVRDQYQNVTDILESTQAMYQEVMNVENYLRVISPVLLSRSGLRKDADEAVNPTAALSALRRDYQNKDDLTGVMNAGIDEYIQQKLGRKSTQINQSAGLGQSRKKSAPTTKGADQ